MPDSKRPAPQVGGGFLVFGDRSTFFAIEALDPRADAWRTHDANLRRSRTAATGIEKHAPLYPIPRVFQMPRDEASSGDAEAN